MKKIVYCPENQIPALICFNGDLEFTYTPEIGNVLPPTLPDSSLFTTTMPVPGYWDDNIERLKAEPFWSKAHFNPKFQHIDFPMADSPPDGSFPYLLGVGWYRIKFHASAVWTTYQVILNVGGVRLEAWVWLNSNFVGHHLGHSTPFNMLINSWLRTGKDNELIIAVANTRTDRSGCVLRGYQGVSGGIYRPVYLRVAGSIYVKDCYIQSINRNQIKWIVELSGCLDKALMLKWTIRDPKTKTIIASDTVPVDRCYIEWETESFGIRSWSDHEPNLYLVDINLYRGNKIMDTHSQIFGLRKLECDGIGLHLNGRPIMLRGITEHCYFPLTCTPPLDVISYREIIRRLKEIGFNWIRFHTWVPSEEYMQAADELGMMIQVEPPVGFEEQEWIDILRTCRKHPSVVIYCCGNEELLDEDKIEKLKQMSALCRQYVPDVLFSPQEALRGIEYCWEEKDFGSDVVQEPYPHNPQRMKLLKEFTDVFTQYAWGFLSYKSVTCDWRELDRRLMTYERPCLTHEVGIHGNYLNLDLEQRYNGTRIGNELYVSVRRNLERAGLLHKASVYFHNSCAWMRILRKHSVENVRKCRHIVGYDFLGAQDNHWLLCGYPCGIMNEFYELKPGETVADILKYNGESVILLDHTNDRNLVSGKTYAFKIMVSLFGDKPLVKGRLLWYLSDNRKRVYQRGEMLVQDLLNGHVQELGMLEFSLARFKEPIKLTIFCHLSGGEYEINNDWDFWVFPSRRFPKRSSEFTKLRIVDSLDQHTLSFLAGGGRVVMLGHKPFPSLPTSFQLSITGRVGGNLATVIADHPLTNTFPHDGYCDWQFYRMLEGGNAIVFNGLNLPFCPIIEVVSSFKNIYKQSSLFELTVGKGKLLVCTLNLDSSDPSAMYMFSQIIKYAESDDFRPHHHVDIKEMVQLLKSNLGSLKVLKSDMAYDPNAQKIYTKIKG